MIFASLHPAFLLLAQAQEGAPAARDPFGSMLPFFILMIVMMYFLTIRPQRKKQKELQAQIESMKIGDSVVTSGGVHGLVTNLKEKTVILKVADNVKIEFEKASVSTVIKKDSPQDKDKADSPEGAEAGDKAAATAEKSKS